MILELNKPADPEIQKLYDWVDAHQEEIVTALVGVLKIRSLEDVAAPNAPFGVEVREALDYTLNLCRDLGFTVKDVDGFAGHAEFGTGAEMVASLGHLDVVPEGDGWEFPPYGAMIKGGYIYARGASDDKGPTYASLFGAAAVMACGLPVKRRIRVIFGCNEESGFQCVEHYFNVANEERPVLGFTPDSGFPLIFAEKGIANLILEKALPTDDRPLKIVSASGGRRPNMVPDSATARLEGTAEAITEAEILLKKFWDKNVSVVRDGAALTVTATGKSAHGSRPSAGDNAIARLGKALTNLELAESDIWLDWVNESNDPTGDALGIAHRDDVAGPLTSNLGILEYTADSKVRLTYNIRYPVTWDITALLAANKPIIDANEWTLADYEDQPPLYVPLDKEPVATLLRVYREASGDTESQPETMGGGTYARATPFTVAYGAHFPTSTDNYGPAHEPDECISINTLLNATKIYATALYELANL